MNDSNGAFLHIKRFTSEAGNSEINFLSDEGRISLLPQKPQPHGDHPDVHTGFRNHQHTDHRFFLSPDGDRKVAGKAADYGGCHFPKTIIACISGYQVKDNQADSGHGKGCVPVEGPAGISLAVQPVVLWKQTQDYTQKSRPPHQHEQSGRNIQAGEGGLPDVHQQNIEDSHCDRRDGKAEAKALFRGSGAAPERPIYAGNQMKSVASSQKKCQGSIQIKDLSPVCLCKKQDGCNEVKQQVSDIKHRFTDLRHSSFFLFFYFIFHVYLYSAVSAAYFAVFCSDNIMLQPLSGEEADGKNDAAAGPVTGHSDPDGNRSEMKYADQQRGQEYTAEPHGQAGRDHGKLYVTSGTHAVGRNEGENPHNRLGDRDESNHLKAHVRSCRIHARQSSYRLGKGEHQQAGTQNNKLCVPGHSGDVEFCLIRFSGSYGLSDYGHQADPDSDSADSVQVFQDNGHGIGCDGNGAQGGYAGLNGKFSKLKHSIFNAGWYADGKNAFDHPEVGADQIVPDHDGLSRKPQESEDNNCAEDSGEQRGKSGSRHAPSENKDKQRVSGNIHQVGEDGYDHGETAVSAGAVKRSSGLEQDEKREGRPGEQEVDDGIMHYIRFYAAEYQGKKRPSPEDADD